MAKERTFDDDLADLLSRIMAAAVVGDDPAPLKEELKALIEGNAQAPKELVTQMKGLVKDGKL